MERSGNAEHRRGEGPQGEGFGNGGRFIIGHTKDAEVERRMFQVVALLMVLSVLAYALFTEILKREKVEKELKNTKEKAEKDLANAWRVADDYERQIILMEKEKAFRDGVEAASETNVLYNRFMRQAASGQGTVILEAASGAPLSLEEWRRSHGQA